MKIVETNSTVVTIDDLSGGEVIAFDGAYYLITDNVDLEEVELVSLSQGYSIWLDRATVVDYLPNATFLPYGEG